MGGIWLSTLTWKLAWHMYMGEPYCKAAALLRPDPHLLGPPLAPCHPCERSLWVLPSAPGAEQTPHVHAASTGYAQADKAHLAAVTFPGLSWPCSAGFRGQITWCAQL